MSTPVEAVDPPARSITGTRMCAHGCKLIRAVHGMRCDKRRMLELLAQREDLRPYDVMAIDELGNMYMGPAQLITNWMSPQAPTSQEEYLMRAVQTATRYVPIASSLCQLVLICKCTARSLFNFKCKWLSNLVGRGLPCSLVPVTLHNILGTAMKRRFRARTQKHNAEPNCRVMPTPGVHANMGSHVSPTNAVDDIYPTCLCVNACVCECVWVCMCAGLGAQV
jgi:hypothetical protein